MVKGSLERVSLYSDEAICQLMRKEEEEPERPYFPSKDEEESHLIQDLMSGAARPRLPRFPTL